MSDDSRCCACADVVCVCAGSDPDCPAHQAPPCGEGFILGANGRCAWCDHEQKCHAETATRRTD